MKSSSKTKTRKMKRYKMMKPQRTTLKVDVIFKAIQLHLIGEQRVLSTPLETREAVEVAILSQLLLPLKVSIKSRKVLSLSFRSSKLLIAVVATETWVAVEV